MNIENPVKISYVVLDTSRTCGSSRPHVGLYTVLTLLQWRLLMLVIVTAHSAVSPSRG